MSERRFFWDPCVGEHRAAVFLDGQPERLLIGRPDDPSALAFGARSVARVTQVRPAAGGAFLDLGHGQGALLPLKADERPPPVGSLWEISIRTEPHADKLAVVQMIAPAEGHPRLLQPGEDVHAALRGMAGDVAIEDGMAARRAVDLAQSIALETEHALPGGGHLAIETTRALTAIDVDLGERAGPAKRAVRAANMTALRDGARLLRLKGLGGLVVFDLVGRGHDGPALLAAAKAAFAADGAGVAIGPVSRFGTIELTIPRRRQPVIERLADKNLLTRPVTRALDLVRLIERQARSQPGSRLTVRCTPLVADHVQAYLPQLAGRIGARFVVEPQPNWSDQRMEVQ